MSGYHGVLAEKLARLVQCVWREQHLILAPRNFFALLKSVHQEYQGNRQHDAQEILQLIMDVSKKNRMSLIRIITIVTIIICILIFSTFSSLSFSSLFYLTSSQSEKISISRSPNPTYNLMISTFLGMKLRIVLGNSTVLDKPASLQLSSVANSTLVHSAVLVVNKVLNTRCSVCFKFPFQKSR